jgi:hypothetical protein
MPHVFYITFWDAIVHFLKKLKYDILLVLYSYVSSFYIIYLTTVFYAHIDIFKKFKYSIIRYKWAR